METSIAMINAALTDEPSKEGINPDNLKSISPSFIFSVLIALVPRSVDSKRTLPHRYVVQLPTFNDEKRLRSRIRSRMKKFSEMHAVIYLPSKKKIY